MRARKKIVVLITIISMISVSLLTGCTPKDSESSAPPPADAETSAPAEQEDSSAQAPEKDKIVIGGARSLTGVFAIFDQTAFGPIYRMWVDKINADGGLYVEEYGKKLPVELLIYDDKSDIATMSRLYEKLMIEDKVDLLIPPVSTAALYALAPMAQKYGYLLMSAEGSSASLHEQIEQSPYFFSLLNFSENQVPVMVDVFNEIGVKTLYIAYIEDLFGTEYLESTKQSIEGTDITIAGESSIPLDMTDFTDIINAAMASNADAFLVYGYPDQNIPITNTAVAMNYNPKAFLLGPGVSYDFFMNAVGVDGVDAPNNIDGLMGFGAWNEKSGPGAKAFRDEFVAKYGPEGENVLNNPDAGDKSVDQDWWGHIQVQAYGEILEQAIAGTGTLDNGKLAEYINENKFQTSQGEVYFIDNFMAPECYVGNIGQWQNGVFEVIDPGENRTADPIYPKANWGPAQ